LRETIFLVSLQQNNDIIMAQEIIGREPEIKEIEALYQTNKPVFAVVYGRRRVGKTFLIRELLGDKFAFYHTGLSPYELQGKKLKEQQLSNFYSSLIKYGSDIKRVPTDWLEAFDALISLLEKKDTNKRQVVFIDELPWMDTPRSGFITALEHFWNGWGAGKENLMMSLFCCKDTKNIVSRKITNHYFARNGAKRSFRAE
jgi:Cdc6-like AAA superfamily ATPase